MKTPRRSASVSRTQCSNPWYTIVYGILFGRGGRGGGGSRPWPRDIRAPCQSYTSVYSGLCPLRYSNVRLPGTTYQVYQVPSTLTYNQPATRFISMIQYCIYCIQLYTVVSPHISSTLTYHGTPDFPPKKRIKILKSFSMAERTNTAYLDWVTPTGVAVLSLDHYPVNSLSSRVVNALARASEHRGQVRGKRPVDPGRRRRGAGPRAFCAGADISGFGNADEESKSNATLPEVIRALEMLPVPTVAAVHGYALGGGFELALGCHYRVIADTAKIGLPEVQIGLLPGAQGTQRLPRIMGAENALKLILSGEHVDAPTALKWGCVDHVASVDALVAAAITFAEQKADARIPSSSLPRISNQPAPNPGACDFSRWRALMSKRRPGEPAPQAIIRCVEAACSGPTFRDGVAVEAREFAILVPSPEVRGDTCFSQSCCRVCSSDQVKPKRIRTVGVVGAGLMGGGIAMCCANVGMKCYVLDVDQASLDRGMELVRSNYERSRSLTPTQKAKALANLCPTTSYADFADCDLVVEAVFEDMKVKKQIFKRLSKVCRRDAFLCSNTSALDIDEIADVVEDPTRVWNPLSPPPTL